MFMSHGIDWERARVLLCGLEETIRDAVLKARDDKADFSSVAEVTAADTIYQVDKISEAAIAAWFEAHWPAEWPVELVMEGLEGHGPAVFPAGTPVERTVLKCIMDPIDGTRNIMYDKRSAWILAALAPQRGTENRLGDIRVAAMTELPTSKQWRSDQISAVRGSGLVSEMHDVRGGGRAPLQLRPSTATDCRHGFAAISKFFPEGKSLLARLEEELWDELYGLGSSPSPLVFDDQYICSGGQMYEILAGHDRMLGDLRPMALAKAGFPSSLVCHPYDVCTAMLLEEAGAVFEHPLGGPVDVPLDTLSMVSWMGYANETLAATVRPVLARLVRKHLS
jgi:fructose-1,6-bisphosphatase/inositol monophosphatase family enzyme